MLGIYYICLQYGSWRLFPLASKLGKDQYTVFFVRVIVICDTPHYVDWISVLCRCALISKSEV